MMLTLSLIKRVKWAPFNYQVINPNTIRQLQERDWIDIVGQRDVPGRPSLYATTKTFLDDLNLKSLADLPPMESFVQAPLDEVALGFRESSLKQMPPQMDFVDDANAEPH